MKSHHITREAFIRTFPSLVVGRAFLPKKRIELQMLLTSVTFGFEPGEIYSERQINERIIDWVSRFGGEIGTDHVTLRRYLVDEGLLARDGFGATYMLAAGSPFFSYDPSIRNLDLETLIVKAAEERAARKRAFQGAEGGSEDTGDRISESRTEQRE